MNATGLGFAHGSLPRAKKLSTLEGRTSTGENDPSLDLLSKTQASSLHRAAKGSAVGGSKPPFVTDKLSTKQAKRGGRVNHSAIDDELSKLQSESNGYSQAPGWGQNMRMTA